MTRRERVLEAIRHHETDIVPYQVDLTSAAYAQLMDLVQDPEYLKRMGNHIVQGTYDMFVGETVLGSGFWRDDFGVVWNRTSIDTDIGFVEGIVLHEPSLSGFHAELNETRLRQGLEQALAAVEDECRVVDVGWGLFERGWTLRGMENLLVDMIAEPKFVDQLFERLCDHQMRVIDIALEYPFDLVLFGDDWGGQTGLILGKKHWQRYLKPHFARMFEKVKNAGKFIALHSCGNIKALFPDLIDIGLDVYQTFQPEIYDIQAVKREYGKALAFEEESVRNVFSPLELRRTSSGLHGRR